MNGTRDVDFDVRGVRRLEEEEEEAAATATAEEEEEEEGPAMPNEAVSLVREAMEERGIAWGGVTWWCRW